MPGETIGFELIVGLGNPGSEYAETRHNAGFWFLDRVAQQQAASFAAESKFFGDVAKVAVGGTTVRLIKPTTFMNRSGQAVAAIARYFKIPAPNILVVHDELDLPAGEARLKFAGGHGGHNGLRDLISHLGGGNFWRARIGIGHPGSAAEVINYVLKPPGKQDAQAIDDAIDVVTAVLPDIVNDRIQLAMNTVHANRRAKK